MRLGKVIGRVTLSVAAPSLKGARWLIVNPYSRANYPNGTEPPTTLSPDASLVVYDNLGGGLGDSVGFIEGREAAMPFDRPVPIDAITAAIIDNVTYTPLT
jgi:carbon dioxide concentrating mechanism protein CcmL